VADYDKIITTKVKRAVANQSYATLFANWQGVSIGDGEVWFSGVGDRNAVRITAIND
jgi:large exoprotein involved in heme utilization and adhesion